MTDASASASRIPAVATSEEEAACWDTHDPSDDWEEVRPATVRVSPTPASVHAVRLDDGDREEPTHHAHARGTDPSALARRWIKERPRAERAHHPDRP